jgi:prophage regulatory protein
MSDCRDKQCRNSKVCAKKMGAISENDNPLVGIDFLTSHSGLSDKWFYKLIREKKFLPPIKLGRSSRWRKSDYFRWLEELEMKSGRKVDTKVSKK